jgi:hypothetical protein
MELYHPIPIQEEPMLRNRWVLRLPEEVKIDAWHVDSVSNLQYDFQNGRWHDIKIVIREFISGDRMRFYDMLEFFEKNRKPIRIELLDGVGIGARDMTVEEYEVVNVSMSELSYAKDGLLLSTLTIRPTCISIGKGDHRVMYSNRAKKKKFWLW